ncbi:MAG: MarR family transcriptional regulator, partial [bacterium]
GRKQHGNFKDELGNDFNTRIEGTRIRHHMGPASVKRYDKHGLVLRIETTAADVSFFKHHRRVDHRDGTSSKKIAPVRKTIYSLGVMRELLGASNHRYLAFLSQLDEPDSGLRQMDKISRPVRREGRSHRGFNLFHGDDLDLFVAIARGEHRISGFRNRDIQSPLDRNGGQVSRLLKRLRVHGLIKKIGRTYKYYLTRLGRSTIACALRLREETVVPALAKS